jgi:DNA polymerase-4
MTGPARSFICRDCLKETVRPGRCAACGSPRLLSHPERDDLTIAHVDCDAFFAAVEKRDDPGLRDKPVIIGGGKRGVVSTACYVARTRGVRSAMPMFKALQLCPDAVVVKPDMEKYRVAGAAIRAMMRDLTPLVEPLSIDEAFLDLSGTERLHGGSAAKTLVRFAREVETQVGVSVSVGLSFNKFLAKIASDLDKPRGFSILGRAEALDFLADKPVTIIFGVGAAAQERLARAGITHIRHLRERPIADLFRLAGKEGERLSRLARAQDDRRVDPERETKSVSSETTFDVDRRGFDELEPTLWRLCEKVSERLKHAGLAGRSITLKLKDSSFATKTRSLSGLAATQLAVRLFEPSRRMLREACDGTAYRLIGIGAGDLCDAVEADRGDLVDDTVVKEKSREAAIDSLRAKFGDGAVVRGLSLRDRRRSP